MAKIQTESIVISLNKLVKESDTSCVLVTEDILNALEQVAQELAGSSIVVEVNVA